MNRYIGPKNKKQECKDYTSKCVIWDGPAIKAPCINVQLCRGDNVEIPIYEVYKKLCEVLSAINIEGLDIDCLADVANSSPTIVDLFNYITQKLCDSKDKLDQYYNLSQELSADLPYCFQYEVNGSVITKLEITEYYELIAARICGALTSLTDIENNFDVAAILAELANISATIASTCNQGPVLVTPTCTNDAVLNPLGDPVKIQTAYAWLEKAFCSFRNFTGTRTDIQNAITYDCPDLGNTPKLYGTGLMSDYYDWVDTPGTLAQSMNNLWLTICDTRNAMRGVLENCCSGGCSNMQIGYQLTINDPSFLTLYFPGFSAIKSDVLGTNKTTPGYRTLNSLGPVAATYSFEDVGAAYIPGSLVGKRVRVIFGLGALQDAVITANTVDNITVSTTGTNWINPVAANSLYEVYEIYDGILTQPSWVTTQFTYFSNVIVTLDDGSGQFVIDSGNNILYWLNSLAAPFGTLTVPYPVGYDYSAPFKTINISFDYKFDNPAHPGDTDCATCECCCTFSLTNGIY